MRHGRLLIGTGLAVLGALALTQLLLPRYVERRTEERLTEAGGAADVSVSAFPAVRLLRSDGDRIRVRSERLAIELGDDREPVLERLDGFDEVDVEVRDLRAGPFTGQTFRLTRAGGSETYALRLSATVTARGLSEYAAATLGGGLGALVMGLSSQLLAPDGAPIPIELDAELASRDGRAELVSGGGTVAGVPAGPLAEALAGAVAARL